MSAGDSQSPLLGWERGLLCRHHFHVGVASCALRPWADDDLHILIEGVEDAKEAFGGKSRVTAVEQLGDIGLFEAQTVGGLNLGQGKPLDLEENQARQFRLNGEVGGIGQCQVGKDIALAGVDGWD